MCVIGAENCCSPLVILKFFYGLGLSCGWVSTKACGTGFCENLKVHGVWCISVYFTSLAHRQEQEHSLEKEGMQSFFFIE